MSTDRAEAAITTHDAPAADRARPGPAGAPRPDPAVPGSGGLRDLAPVGVVAVVGGLVLRFVVRSSLWLDEALSVDIAALPVGDIGAALRQDGHPPLYYLLLHVWISVFGDGDVAVRALSGVLAVVALPLMWSAGNRLGGRRVAALAVVLLASSPFAVRYATEARMYSMVMLLSLAGYLAVLRALQTPTVGRLSVVAGLTGALLLTHYWSLYLLAGATAVLLARAWSAPRARPTVRRVLAGMTVGCLSFVPWVGSFLHQVSHTGTPWGKPANVVDAVLETLVDFGGGKWAGGRLLGLLLAVLVSVALVARFLDRDRPGSRAPTGTGVLAALGLGAVTLAAGVLVTVMTGSAYESRYAAGVLPFVLLAAAVGTARLPHHSLRAVVAAALVVTGLAGGVRASVRERTQADEVATVLDAGAQPGDIVAFCPDQLAVSVHRLVNADVDEMTYPAGNPAGRVNWVDYSARVRAADPGDFASALVDRAGSSHRIWVVSGANYRGFARDCEAVLEELHAARPGGDELVSRDAGAYERHTLTRFDTP